MLAVAFLVLVLARPAAAFISIPDPVEAGLLAKISAVLATMQRLRLLLMEKWYDQLWVRLDAYVFPEGAFNQVFVITSTVDDIRRELNKLACVWPTTARTNILEDVLLKRMVLCRDEYRHTWGSHDGMWDAELQEMHDYAAAMTTNMISERTEKTNTTWVQALREEYLDAAQRFASPGEANRNEAAALALTNQVALGNAQIVTQDLLLKQMDRDLDRYDQKKADDMTYYMYRGVTTLAGQEWRGAPPDPSRDEP